MTEVFSEQNVTRALWDYALAAYQRPGVAAACLALQDEEGLDVNLLLAAAFCGERGQRWRPRDVQALVASVAPLREALLLPLRALRRTARERAPEGVYQQFKVTELALEQWQLQQLAPQLAALPVERGACLRENLLCYGGGIAPKAEPSLEALAALLQR